MKTHFYAFLASGALALAPLSAQPNAAADPEALQKQVDALFTTVKELQRQLAELQSLPGPVDPGSENPARRSPVPARAAFNDQQGAAPRPDNLVLDPHYRGFIPVPNTQGLVKINAKPRVDITADNRYAGEDNRFAVAKIPVVGDPAQGGGRRSNINSKGSQLQLDVRGPALPGTPRFYYQNDFYGSGPNEFNYRVQQLYGEYYNFVIGQTYSVFEDPDVWPDTVDYEGPNAMIFARRPLVRYQWPLTESWQLNVGAEQPKTYADDGRGTATGSSEAPDFGINARWEDPNVGHFQAAGIVRRLGSRSPRFGDQTTTGWGLSVSGTWRLSPGDTLQALVAGGEGIGALGNDTSFFNTDAAYDGQGELKPLPYFAGMIGYTHAWNDIWRSTVTYGYVTLDNEVTQEASAYHTTHYASANVIWQMQRRLQVGLEGLYGRKEAKAGATGDVLRLQLGFMYSLFD